MSLEQWISERTLLGSSVNSGEVVGGVGLVCGLSRKSRLSSNSRRLFAFFVVGAEPESGSKVR